MKSEIFCYISFCSHRNGRPFVTSKAVSFGNNDSLHFGLVSYNQFTVYTLPLNKLSQIKLATAHSTRLENNFLCGQQSCTSSWYLPFNDERDVYSPWFPVFFCKLLTILFLNFPMHFYISSLRMSSLWLFILWFLCDKSQTSSDNSLASPSYLSTIPLCIFETLRAIFTVIIMTNCKLKN